MPDADCDAHINHAREFLITPIETNRRTRYRSYEFREGE